jgi:hypothetical protein
MSTETFKASDIISHFNSLRKMNNNEEKWWGNYIDIEWNKIRLGKNSTKWITFKYTPDLSIKHKRLNVVIRNEVHSGQIMPATMEDVAELKAKFPDARIELRTMKPSLQFQKWSKQVPTQEDRITPLYNDRGEQIVPDDEYLSNYYQVACFIDEIFRYEMKKRTERGTFLIVYLSQNKDKSVQEIKNTIGHINDCDTILRDEDVNTIREKYPDKFNEIMKGVLTTSNTKVGTLIQERISDKAIKNGGVKLPNPMTRITIPFDKKGMPAGVTILDKSKIFKCNGKVGYENATYNDVPINANNIHWFIPSRSIIDGVINMDSICFSQLGISLPIKASLIVVKQPMKKENNIFNMCYEIYGNEYDNELLDEDIVNITNINNNVPSSSNNITNNPVSNEEMINDLNA